MCERHGVYLGLRRGDAAALLTAAALALVVVPGSAGAAGDNVQHATDPSATADALLFQRLGGPAVISRGGPGDRAAGHGTPRSAAASSRPCRATRSSCSIATPWPGRADARARAPTRSPSRMPGSPTAPRSAGATGSTSATSPIRRRRPRPSWSPRRGRGAAQPPAVDGNILLYAVATPRGSRVVQRVMGTRKHRTLVRSPRLLLFDPAVDGQVLRLRPERRAPQPADGSRAAVARLRPGPLRPEAVARRSFWSNALTGSVAYATILEPSASNADATIVQRQPPAPASASGSARRAAAATTGSSYQPGGGVNALSGGCA